MADPFEVSQELGEMIAGILGENYEDLAADRQQAFRRVGFAITEAIYAEKIATHKSLSGALGELMTFESTPKRWMPGLKEARSLIYEIQSESRRVSIPDVVVLSATPDPYLSLTSGHDDPMPLPIDAERCGDVGEGEFECTRPPHDPTWQHWDSDASTSSFPELSGSILATWDHTGELTSIHIQFSDGLDI